MANFDRRALHLDTVLFLFGVIHQAKVVVLETSPWKADGGNSHRPWWLCLLFIKY